MLWAAPAYLERRGAPERPKELLDHDCLVHWVTAPHPRAEWAFRAPAGGTVEIRPAWRARASAGPTLRGLAVAGCGIARLPTANAGDDLRAGRLVRVLPDWPPAGIADRAIWPIYAGNRAVPPKVRAFIDFLAKRIGDPPYRDLGLA